MGWKEETRKEYAAKLEPLIRDGERKSNEELKDIYLQCRARKDELEAQLKEVNLHILAAETVFFDRFAEEDTKTMKFNDGVSITCSVGKSYVIADKSAFIDWLKATGQEDRLTVYSQSVPAIVRGEDGNDPDSLPPGIVEGDPVKKFSVRGR